MKPYGGGILVERKETVDRSDEKEYGQKHVELLHNEELIYQLLTRSDDLSVSMFSFLTKSYRSSQS